MKKIEMNMSKKEVTNENKVGWMLANRHLLELKIEGEKIFAYNKETGEFVLESLLPKTHECDKYSRVSMVSKEPVRMEIPCVAKQGDVMWYCMPKGRDEQNLNSGLFFDKNDIKQVRITHISGASDITICYVAKDINGETVSGMQSLFHHTLEELLAFIDEANTYQDACDFFWNWQQDYDENKNNKARYRYLLTNNKYLINQQVIDDKFIGEKEVSRILFNSYMSCCLQFKGLWTDEEKREIIPFSEDLAAQLSDDDDFRGFVLSDGRKVSNVCYSLTIPWDSFTFEANE